MTFVGEIFNLAKSFPQNFCAFLQKKFVFNLEFSLFSAYYTIIYFHRKY